VEEAVTQPQLEELTSVKVRRYYQRSLSPGELIFDEGDPGDQLYVIQSGEVELVRENPARERVVARLGPGDFFGELGVVAGERRSVRAVAVNTTRLIALDRETLEAMCLEQPVIAIRMIRVLVSRLVEAERRLAALGIDDLMRPVVRSLIRLGVAESDSGLRVESKLAEIANASGLSMLEVHRALHQLFDRKLVTLEDDVLHIPNCEALTGVLEPA
jgi:CRP/FNR family transcriptional regulator, cyclic AMP receptor protein